jgi:iron complex outermembrane receptor protein
VIGGPGGPGAVTGREFQDVFKSFQPRVILEFAPTPSTNVYASVAEGVRPGDFNANLNLFTPAELAEIEREIGGQVERLDEEKIRMYEVGFKGRLFDRMTVAVAGYWGDWTNQHVFTNLTIGDIPGQPGTGRGIDITTSTGDSKVYGAELEGTFRATDRLTLDYSAAYTRAELGAGYTCPTCIALTGTRVVTGNQKARVPKTSGHLGANFAHEWSTATTAVARVELRHKGNIYAEDANLASTGSSNKVNVTYTVDRGPLSVSVYGTNVFDDDTYPSMSSAVNQYDRGTPVAGFPAGPARAVRVSLPEKPVYGVRAAYRFSGN